MAITVKLVRRDHSFYKDVRITEFYIRPDAIVADGIAFVTDQGKAQRDNLVYVEVMTAVPIP